MMVIKMRCNQLLEGLQRSLKRKEKFERTLKKKKVKNSRMIVEVVKMKMN